MKIYLCVASSIEKKNAIEARIKTWLSCLNDHGLSTSVISLENKLLVEDSNDSLIKRAFKTIFSAIYFQLLIIKKFHIKDSLFIISSPPFLPAMISAMLCILLRKKYFFEVRDPYPRVFWELGLFKRDSLIIKILHRLESYVLRKASAIIITDFFNLLDEFKAHSENISIVHNGAFSRFDKNNRLINKNFKVCHLGRMGKFQNPMMLDSQIDEMIKSESIDSISFIGDVYNDDNKKIKNFGRIKPETVQENLASFDIGLSFRSKDESSDVNIPIRIYEYLNAGMSIRTNNSSALRVYEEELKETYGFSPFSFIEDESISEFVKRLKEDGDDYKLLTNNFLRYNNMRKFIHSNHLIKKYINNK